MFKKTPNIKLKYVEYDMKIAVITSNYWPLEFISTENIKASYKQQ